MDKLVEFQVTRRTLLRASLALGFISVLAASANGADIDGIDIEKANQEGVVNFYMSLDPRIADAIIKPFTEKYGIVVKYYRASPPSLIAKVLQEADANRLAADLLDASAVDGFIQLKKRGLLLPYDSPAARFVPAGLKDVDKTWTADRLTQYVIQYNTKAVPAAGAPLHWKDLADPKYANNLVFVGDSSGDGASAIYRMAQEFGWDLIEKIGKNKPIRVGSPQLESQMIEQGERIAGFNQNDNAAWSAKQRGQPTETVYPTEGVFSEPGAIGILKGAAHPNAARLFYDWWLGDFGQKVLIQGGKYSSRTDIAPPAGNPPLSQLKLLLLDYPDWEKNRPDALRRITQIFGGDWGL